jgi:hypothetical protein
MISPSPLQRLCVWTLFLLLARNVGAGGPALTVPDQGVSGLTFGNQVVQGTREIPSLPPSPIQVSDVLVPPAPEPLVSAESSTPIPETTQSSERVEFGEWTVIITPRKESGAPVIAARYTDFYNAIPYRRAEYLANPSYRHDTAVEMLFGQLRPVTINRNDLPQRIVNPRPQFTQPYPISKGELYSYWPLLQYGSPLPLLSPIQ